jgi:hypothetical protein
MKVYYAHCLSLYGTKQESRDIATLESLGFTVENPNCPLVQEACDFIRADALAWNERNAPELRNPSEEVMEYFRGFTLTCDCIAFRALPDGRIPGGVYKEIAMFKQAGKPVFELPSGVLSRGMTIEQTREFLGEVGYR